MNWSSVAKVNSPWQNVPRSNAEIFELLEECSKMYWPISVVCKIRQNWNHEGEKDTVASVKKARHKMIEWATGKM